MKPVAVIASCALLLGACSRNEPSIATAPDDNPGADRATMKTEAYNPWKEQMRAMDKARGVEGMLQQGAQQRDLQLRQMEQ
ncbi:MAG TPA: hypothetical protein EYP90_05820 [Chromatiaceae bacterium]|nr:hypothetical protein [Chromatiaceae bacterium]